MEDNNKKDIKISKVSGVSTGNTSGGKKAAGSRPVGGTQSAGNRPVGNKSAGGTQSAGSRPAGGTSSAGRAKSSRPRSATATDKKVTSTGRPLQKSVSQGTGAKKTGTKSSSGRSTTARASASARKRREQIQSRNIIIAAVVVGLLFALIVTFVMRASMLKVKQIETDYNIGDTFNITSFFEGKSKKTKIEFDNKSFVPDKLGTYKLEFTVRRGKLSTTKKKTINVVDVEKPYIDGPESIEVMLGEKIVWSDYFDVIDADPDIADKLTVTDVIDTSAVEIYNTTLTVTDWGGNESTKDITVFVTNNTDPEQ